MERVQQQGHVRDQDLAALTGQGLPDDQRAIDLAEHLEHCDQCMERYLQHLSQMPLLEPPASLSRSIQEQAAQIQQQKQDRHRRRFFCATLLAAALWIFALWVLPPVKQGPCMYQKPSVTGHIGRIFTNNKPEPIIQQSVSH